MEKPHAQETFSDQYGWSEAELQMSLLYQGQFLDPLPTDGSKRLARSAARWDGHKQRVIIRAVDGFEYIIEGVNRCPDYIEAQKFYEAARD